MKKIIILCMLLWTPMAYAASSSMFELNSYKVLILLKFHVAQHGGLPTSFLLFSKSYPKSTVLSKFKAVLWDVGGKGRFHVKLLSVENENYQVTIDSDSSKSLFSNAVKKDAMVLLDPASTYKATESHKASSAVEFTSTDFALAEAAAHIFWSAFRNRDFDTVRNAFSKNVSDAMTAGFRDKLNDQNVTMMENLVGKYTKFLSSTQGLGEERKSWIKVEVEFKRHDDKIHKRSSYFNKEGDVFKVIKL